MAQEPGKGGLSPRATRRFQGLPVASAALMRSLDERAVREYGIPVVALMENAGKAVAAATVAWLGREAARSRVVVVCGRGNNGGDGLVAARYLKDKVAGLRVFLAAEAERPYGKEVAANLERLKAEGVVSFIIDKDAGALDAGLAQATCVLDAVLGTGFTGEPRGTPRLMIESMARCGKPVVAVDVPSGLDADSGAAEGPCVRADLTLTLGMAKRGLLEPRAREFVGKLDVLDIGFPKGLLEGTEEAS